MAPAHEKPHPSKLIPPNDPREAGRRNTPEPIMFPTTRAAAIHMPIFAGVREAIRSPFVEEPVRRTAKARSPPEHTGRPVYRGLHIRRRKHVARAPRNREHIGFRSEAVRDGTLTPLAGDCTHGTRPGTSAQGIREPLAGGSVVAEAVRTTGHDPFHAR